MRRARAAGPAYVLIASELFALDKASATGALEGTCFLSFKETGAALVGAADLGDETRT